MPPKSFPFATEQNVSIKRSLHDPHTTPPGSKALAQDAEIGENEHQGRFEVLFSPPTNKKRKAWHDGILSVTYKQSTLLSLQPFGPSRGGAPSHGGMIFVTSEKQATLAGSGPTPLYSLLIEGVLKDGFETSLSNGSYQINIQRVLHCTVGRDEAPPSRQALSTTNTVSKGSGITGGGDAPQPVRKARTTLHTTARPPTPTPISAPPPAVLQPLRPQAPSQNLGAPSSFLAQLHMSKMPQVDQQLTIATVVMPQQVQPPMQRQQQPHTTIISSHKDGSSPYFQTVPNITHILTPPPPPPESPPTFLPQQQQPTTTAVYCNFYTYIPPQPR